MYVVPVYRAEVHETEVFKKRRRENEALGVARDFLGELGGRLPEEVFDKGVHVGVQPVVARVRYDLVQVFCDGAHVFCYRHFVIVQHDYHPLGRGRDVVERLESHPVGEGGVAEHRHDILVSAVAVARGGKPQRGGGRRPRVPRSEGVVLALEPVAKAAYSVGLAQRLELLVVAPRQELVRIALVGYVEKYLVLRSGKHPVQGYGKLHYPEVGGNVPALFGGDCYYLAPDFLRELRQLLRGEGLYVLGGFYIGKYGHIVAL